MSDKQIGYALMILTLALTCVMTVYLIKTSYNPVNARTLRFPEVGSLNVEDPIRMKGMQVGEISGFDHDDSGRVLVHTVSSKPIPIRTSSVAAVKVKGVMGERFIEITPGDTSDPLIAEGVIVDGIFEMGPSEAIVYMDLLKEKIIELRDIMLWLRDGKDDGKRPFIVAFNDVVGKIDTLVYDLLVGIGGMEAGLNHGLDMASDISLKSTRLVTDVSVKAPEVIESINNVVVKIDETVPKIEAVFSKLDSLVTKIDGNTILWGEHSDKVQKSLKDVKKIVNDIREDGLPLNVRLRVF